MQNEFDVIIVGKGPAGISAALYVLRSGLSVLLLAKDAGALSRAHQIANYYGLENTISGQELAHRGEEQAKKLGAEVVTGEVVDLMFAEKFHATIKKSDGTEQTFFSKAVIIAAGTVRSKVPIPGLDSFEGKGVSYCAVCDGFFYRKKNVAVLGNGAYALPAAKEFLQRDLYQECTG